MLNVGTGSLNVAKSKHNRKIGSFVYNTKIQRLAHRSEKCDFLTDWRDMLQTFQSLLDQA